MFTTQTYILMILAAGTIVSMRASLTRDISPILPMNGCVPSSGKKVPVPSLMKLHLLYAPVCPAPWSNKVLSTDWT